MSAPIRVVALALVFLGACDREAPPPGCDEQTCSDHTDALAKVDDRLKAIEARLATIEAQQASESPDRENEIEALSKRLDTVTTNLGAVETHVTELETKLGSAAVPQDPATGEDGELEKIGVPECDEYVAKYMQCIDEKMPAAARETSKKALKMSVEAWRKAAATPAARGPLAEACKTATDAVKAACGW